MTETVSPPPPHPCYLDSCQPCSKTAYSTCPGQKAASMTPGPPSYTYPPSPLRGKLYGMTWWPSGSLCGMGVWGGGVTAYSIRPPRFKMEGLWSGFKSACKHHFVTRGPILCRPNHTGEDKICRMARAHLGVGRLCAFSPERHYKGEVS